MRWKVGLGTDPLSLEPYSVLVDSTRLQSLLAHLLSAAHLRVSGAEGVQVLEGIVLV